MLMHLEVRSQIKRVALFQVGIAVTDTHGRRPPHRRDFLRLQRREYDAAFLVRHRLFILDLAFRARAALGSSFES